MSRGYDTIRRRPKWVYEDRTTQRCFDPSRSVSIRPICPCATSLEAFEAITEQKARESAHAEIDLIEQCDVKVAAVRT